MRDMNSKGRGVGQLRAVLTEQMVIEARQRFADGEAMSDIIEDFEHPHALVAAVHGHNWKHVPMPDYSERPTKPVRSTRVPYPRPSQCPIGHPYDEANTAYKSEANGRRQRYCKECNRSRAREVLRKRYAAEGRTPAPPNSQKTHCPSGHEYSLENTRVRPDGYRICRTCHREAEKRRKLRA